MVISAGSLREALAIAAWMSCAAASMFRLRLNCTVIRPTPRPLTEVIESTPAMVANSFSSGVAIEAAGGGAFGGYLALPPGGGPAPGIIVILEIRGVNANLRTICDEYAARGYLALAPDLLWRIEPGLDYDPDTPAGWDKAMAIHAAFDEGKAVADLIASLA